MAQARAGLQDDRRFFKGRKVGLLLAGGDIDPRRLAAPLYREMVREGRMVTFRILGEDRPGVLAA